jgi:hypothetical protein
MSPTITMSNTSNDTNNNTKQIVIVVAANMIGIYFIQRFKSIIKEKSPKDFSNGDKIVRFYCNLKLTGIRTQTRIALPFVLPGFHLGMVRTARFASRSISSDTPLSIYDDLIAAGVYSEEERDSDDIEDKETEVLQGFDDDYSDDDA